MLQFSRRDFEIVSFIDEVKPVDWLIFRGAKGLNCFPGVRSGCAAGPEDVGKARSQKVAAGLGKLNASSVSGATGLLLDSRKLEFNLDLLGD